MKAIEKEHNNIRSEIKGRDLFSESKVEELLFNVLNEKYIDDLTEILTYWLGELQMIVFPPEDTDDIRVTVFVENMDIASIFSLNGAIEHFLGGYDKKERERIKTALLNIAESIKIEPTCECDPISHRVR